MAILLALREGEHSAFSPAGLDQLVVRGLALDEASELLGGGIATSVARRLAELTIGNPTRRSQPRSAVTPSPTNGLGTSLSRRQVNNLRIDSGPARA